MSEAMIRTLLSIGFRYEIRRNVISWPLGRGLIYIPRIRALYWNTDTEEHILRFIRSFRLTSTRTPPM